MGLQIWLPLNGNLINQGLDGTTTITNGGATVNTNGKIGKCYAFDGTQYIKVQSPYLKSYLCNSSVPFTMACWIYLNTDETDRAIIFGGYNANPFINWELMANCTQVLYAGGTSNYTGKSNGTVVPKTAWTHIAVTYDGNNTAFFMNGNKLSSVSGANTIASALGSDTFYLGSDVRSGSTRLKGCINDFRFYDCTLSPREIKEISKGLVLHYPLNREGFGADNLLSRYVSPGQQNPGATADWGRTKYYGDYGIIIPATKNADTYFRLFLRKQLTSNAVYTISCQVSGLVDGTFYAFPLFAQGNVAMGSLLLNHNGLNSMTFTMTYGTQTAVTVGSETVYICFMDDANRSIATGQGPITVTNFKIEEGSTATPFVPAPTDALYTKMGLDDNIVYDTSGYKYNGTVVDGGISYSSDTVRYNVSAEFDGVNSAIAIPWSIFYKQGDVFTLNLWWKKSSLGSKNYETLFGGSGIEMDTRAGGASTLSLYMASTRGGNLYTPFSFNEWYMNTLVNDGTNELYYVNGQLVKTIEKKNMPTGTCYIGAWTSHTSQNYKGLISDFRIYKTALSADDILELYHTPITLSNNGTLMTQGEYVEV